MERMMDGMNGGMETTAPMPDMAPSDGGGVVQRSRPKRSRRPKAARKSKPKAKARKAGGKRAKGKARAKARKSGGSKRAKKRRR
jgi:hypothetical protein